MKGGPSGGYLDFIFKQAAKEIWGITIDNITYKVGRNQDSREAILEVTIFIFSYNHTKQVNGEKYLHFVQAYGFRNIQNIIRNIKKGTSTYDYVEVMACPGGCTSGG